MALPGELGYDGTLSVDARWWQPSDKLEAHQRLWGVFQSLREQDRHRRRAYQRHMRLYGGMPVRGGAPEAYVQPRAKDVITFNVIANMCDMATNRIGRQQPMPVAKVRGGNYTLHTKGLLLERFFEAQFRISDVYAAARAQFLDATIFGTGVLHVYQDGKGIRVERVLPHQLLVDHREAVLSGPRQMMREHYMSRDVARAKFVTSDLSKRERGRRERILMEAGVPEADDGLDGFIRGESGTSDQILVVEAYRLPSGEGQGDGKRAFAVTSGLLEVEDWERDEFPFLELRWKPHPLRYWGIGLAEELTGIQVEMNLMLRKIQQAYHLVAKPFILMNVASQIPKGSLDNEIGTIVRYSGDKPEIWTPNAFHPEFYAHFERLYSRAFEIAGFTQDMPTAEGTRSAVQIEKKHAVESERFSVVAMRFEENMKALAEHMMVLAKELGPDYGVPDSDDRGSIETIRWADIDLEDDQFYLGVQNISALSTLFSERIKEVMALQQLGQLSAGQALRLMQIPDLDKELRLQTSPERNIDRIVEGILDDGIYAGPEPHMQLDLAIQRMQLWRNWADTLRDVDDDKLQAMDDWLEEAHRLQEKAALEQAKKAAEAAAGMGSGALTPGVGSPLPIGNGGAAPVEQAAPQEGPTQ